jgi:hypothetical protein
LRDLNNRESFDHAWKILGDEKVQTVFYRTESSRARFQSQYEYSDENLFYKAYWLPVAQLFREDRSGAQKVDTLLMDLFDLNKSRRPLMVIDLSLEQTTQASRTSRDSNASYEDLESVNRESPLYWTPTIQALVIKRLLEGIRFVAERAYHENRSLNTLVLIDEAHRLASREDPENEEMRAVRALLVDAARTTRKYGLGWMFISQTLSSLHREILEQLRIFFFGFGLGMGMEFRALSELVGGRSKALDLYQLFRDPHSSFDIESREYSFMTIGPVSPLSFAGTPLFFNAFNTVSEFLESNSLGEEL